MKKIACWTMIGAKNTIKDRPNSYEIFGIDYMIDINYNTWLIEINKNPALEYSTVSHISNDLFCLINALSQQQRGCHDNFKGISLILWKATT